MAAITLCPPKPARGILPPETAFGLIGKQPVSVEFGRDGEIRSTGFDFGDYSRAQTTGEKLAGGRRLPCPAWALNSSSMAEVIARAFERRAGFFKPTPGNPLERLQRAQQCILAKIPRQTEIMTRLCREYASLKKLPGTSAVAARLKALQEEIENIDSQIRLSREFPAKVARAIYLYWRCGWDSPAVASELGMKPPHIRRTLANLCETARRIEREKREGVEPKIPKQLQFAKVAAHAPREPKPLPPPQHCAICGAEFIPIGRKRKTCGSAECKRQRAIRYRRNKRGTPETRSPRCADCGTELMNVQAQRCKPCKAAYRRGYIREWNKTHAPTRIPTRILTREEKKILALRLWSQGAKPGEITRAMGYRAGFGYNFLNRVLRTAGVKK